MITDAILGFVLDMLERFVNLIPDHTLDLPDPTPIMTWFAKVNSLVPIGGVMGVAVSVLALLGAFLVARALLLVWKALPLT